MDNTKLILQHLKKIDAQLAEEGYSINGPLRDQLKQSILFLTMKQNVIIEQHSEPLPDMLEKLFILSRKISTFYSQHQYYALHSQNA